MTISLCRREAKEDFRGILIVPVEYFIPGGLQRICTVFAGDNLFGYICALRIFLGANIDIGIQVQTHQQGSSRGFIPLSLIDSISGGSSLDGQEIDTVLQFGFNEFEEFVRTDVCLGILGDI